MKTYFTISVAVILLLSACNTPEGVTSRVYNDDIYYSSQDAAADKEKKQAAVQRQNAEDAKKAEQTRSDDYVRASEKAPSNENTAERSKADASDDYYQSKSTTEITTSGGNTYVTNNYYDQPFNYDDYYDYEYSVRLRRFHNTGPSYGYYDNYYTNSYWYTGNPYNYGSSVYLGYNWWGPSYVSYSYNPSVYWYASYGWGYDPWYHPCGYNPYPHGYYSYGYYGYNPYMNGYMDGYYHGYNNGYYSNVYNNNYFNTYDNNSYYYGPRKTTGSNGRQSPQPALASRYTEAVQNKTINGMDEDRVERKPIGIDNNRNIGSNLNDNPGTGNPSDQPLMNRNEKPAKSIGGNNTGTGNVFDNEPARPVKPAKSIDRTTDNEIAPVRIGNDPIDHNNNPTPVRTRENQGFQNGGTQTTEPVRIEQPKREQQQRPARIEQPRNEQIRIEQPRNEQPRNQQQQTAPAPRNNSNNNSSAPSRGPRR